MRTITGAQRCDFVYDEAALINDQAPYAGWATHELIPVDGKLRIQFKRADLTNRDAALPNTQLYL